MNLCIFSSMHQHAKDFSYNPESDTWLVIAGRKLLRELFDSDRVNSCLSVYAWILR